MQIKCDRCGSVAETVVPETARNGDIEHYFFRCPKCGAVYPISATDTALRESIARFREMRKTIKTSVVTEEYLHEAEELYQKNIKRNRELMEQHPLALFLRSAETE